MSKSSMIVGTKSEEPDRLLDGRSSAGIVGVPDVDDPVLSVAVAVEAVVRSVELDRLARLVVFLAVVAQENDDGGVPGRALEAGHHPTRHLVRHVDAAVVDAQVLSRDAFFAALLRRFLPSPSMMAVPSWSSGRLVPL